MEGMPTGVLINLLSRCRLSEIGESDVRKLIRSTPVVVAALCCLAFGSVTSLRELGTMQWLELLAYDLMVRARPIERPRDERIVVIGAGESDLNKWGWPLTDETLAAAVEKVLKWQPRVIGVDLYRDRSVPPGHDRLTDLLQRHDHIIWVSKFGDRRSRGVPPLRFWRRPNATASLTSCRIRMA